MKAKHLIMAGITVLMVSSVLLGAVQALESQPASVSSRAALENVRDYAPALTDNHTTYAIDAGVLYAGRPGAWTEVRTPQNIIVNAVALDSKRPDIVYIGAANALTLYKSTDYGRTWAKVPLSEAPGGVTDIAVDSVQRLVYAGTDTAGVFRLRDVGSSVIVGGHLLLDEPVRQVAADNTGVSLAFVRTDTALYRAENFGLTWSVVDNLHSSPTAIAIADTIPATVYVGTVDRGLLSSIDGQTWRMANEGLGLLPGTRLHVDALAVDPQQPEQLYAAASYLNGTTTVHQSPSHIAASSNGAATWDILDATVSTSMAASSAAIVNDLLPVSGTAGAVYALTNQSRRPVALFDEAAIAVSPTAAPEVAAAATSSSSPPPVPAAWLIAALAALALGTLVTVDLHKRGVHTLRQGIAMSALETQTVTVASIS